MGKISFADINDGKAYVEDATALALWGIPGPNGTRIHSEADAEFPDCEDPKQLLTLTKEALKTRSQPVVSYECDVTSLAAAGVNAEGTDIGDTVHIIDTSFPTPLRLEGRILQIEQDLTGDQTATTITLGNITTGITHQDDAWRRQLDQLISNSGAWNDAATGTKPYITDLINRINQIMNTTGGYTYLKPGQGIYVYDKPEDQNPTQCIHIGGGYWRIANSKKANGDWDFRALADGNGIYANTIYTGKLSDAAGHNQWNLDTGELTTRGMTATSITAEGTFACGSKDWYGIELNSIGQLAGYRKGKKVGYIDYSGGMYEVSNPSKVYYGLQLQGGCLRISTPILSVAKTTDTHVTTTHAYNGKHSYISKITSSSDGTITAVAQTGPVEYRELVGYENAAQGYAVRVSDRTWLCCFNSFAMQTDGTTRLPYFYAFLRQAGSSSLTALVANPFDTNGITLLSTDGEQMRFSYGGGGRWAGVRAVSGLDAATLILTEA